MSIDRLPRWVKVVAGFALLAVGVVMLVTPGPGALAIAGGVAMLATEYVWARRVRERFEHVAAVWGRKRS